MFDFDDEDEAPSPEEVARIAAESLEDASWQARFGACRTLETVGAAAAPHAKLLAKLAARDKEADVRKAAQGVLNALIASGVELPADYKEGANEDDEERLRAEKKKQREEAWAERRKQREKEWEEKQKVLEEQDKLAEQRQRREEELLYKQYENYYEEPPAAPAPEPAASSSMPAAPPSSYGAYAAAPPEYSAPAAAYGAPAYGSAPEEASAPSRRGGRRSAFAEFRPPSPPPNDQNPYVAHPAFARQPEEQPEFEIAPESDSDPEAVERGERQKELRQKEEESEERRKKKAETAGKMPEDVGWEGPRANFRLLGEVLPMRLESKGMSPNEVSQVWEKRWGIPYASHVKFEGPPGSEKKWLHPRDDCVPLHPAVVTLHDKAGSMLVALATGMREYGGLLPEEAEAARLGKLQQSLASAERRQRASARERERIHQKEVRARAKGGTFQERQDKRVQELRGIVNKALGVSDSTAEGRPQRQMRELRRSSVS